MEERARGDSNSIEESPLSPQSTESESTPKVNFELQKNKNKIKLISDCFYGERKRDIVVTLVLIILGLLIYRELKLEQVVAKSTRTCAN